MTQPQQTIPMQAQAPANPLAPLASLQMPDAGALEVRATQALKFIDDFVIDSAETYSLAGEELRAIKVRENDLELQRKRIVDPINAGLRAINALFKRPGDLLALAESKLKAKMIAFQTEQQRLADEQRREAEAAAEEERRRLAAEATARQAEADRKLAEAAQAAAAGDTTAASIATSEAHRAAAEAQTTAAVAQMVTAPVVQPTNVAKAAGVSTAQRIDFEVTDPLALVKHVAERPELLNLVSPDEKAIRAYVRGLGLACQLPGVRVFPASTVRVRT